ncbi:MAG: Flp family type IVb pilin [Dechloromonas sp.]|nr:Flp family type IVb pilin [Dechloromonas sp.]
MKRINLAFLKERAAMKQAFLRFLRDEEGATAVEYGLIAALIAVAIILSITDLGDKLKDVFETIKNALP